MANTPTPPKDPNKSNVPELHAGLMTTLSTGCQGYEPLANVPFDPQKGHTFNPKLSTWCINACAYAYQDLCHPNNITYPPEVENGKILYWYEGKGIFSKPKKTSCGYIAQIKPIAGDSTNRIVIILRGTQTSTEWLEDADDGQIEINLQPLGKRAKIHNGFWDILNKPADANTPSLQDQIHELLPTYFSKTAPNELYIAGHSMGSAVATLVLLDALLRYPHLAIYTYITGSPRVGDPSLAAAFLDLAKNSSLNFLLVREVNTEDIIPTLPPPVNDAILYHHGVVYSHLIVTDPGLPNTIDLVSFTKNMGTIWDNHHLFNYYYGIKKLIP